MTAAQPTGAELADELRLAAAKAGVSVYAFVAPLATSNASSFLANLAKAQRPYPLTVERVRARCAGLPIPEPRRSAFAGRFGGPSRFVSGEHHDSLLQREAKIELGDRARDFRRPGETMADSLRRLEEESDADQERAEAQSDAEARRARELAELASPSALIRRAARDWPQQSAAVAAIAAELGVAKGEAWHRVIAAGIETLSEGGAG